MPHPFTETPALCGPLRRPRQMLAAQQDDGPKQTWFGTGGLSEAAELGRGT